MGRSDGHGCIIAGINGENGLLDRLDASSCVLSIFVTLECYVMDRHWRDLVATGTVGRVCITEPSLAE